MLKDAEETRKKIIEDSAKIHCGHVCPFDVAILSQTEIENIVSGINQHDTALIEQKKTLFDLCAQDEKCPDLNNCPWKGRLQ